MSRQQQLTLTALSIFAFSVLILIALQPVDYHLKAHTFVDDAYYYLGYAKHVANGVGPTFDGVIMTNGVQPLWSVLLSLVAVFVQGELALMQASLILSIALLAMSYVFMVQILRRFFSGNVLYLTLLLYIGLIATPSIFMTGMEAPVILFSLTVALWTVLRISSFNWFHHLVAGCVLSLVFMSRLDLLMMTPTFALLLIWSNGTLKERDWNKAVQSVIGLAIPCVIVFGSYLAYNLSVFGVPLPMSGMVKSAIYERTLDGGRLTIPHLLDVTQSVVMQVGTTINYYFTTLLISFSIVTLLARIVFLIGFVLVLIMIYRHRYAILRTMKSNRTGSQLQVWVPLLILLNLIFHAWVQIFVTGFGNVGSLNWYHVHEYIFLTLLIGFIASGLAKVPNQRVIGGLTLWALVSLVVGLVFWVRTTTVTEGVQPFTGAYQAVQWVNENVPDDAIIGSFNAGISGYFSKATVINLDGLMNDTEVLEILKGNGTFVDYARKYNIGWIMDHQLDASNPLGESFRGFPLEMLTLHHAVPFTNFGFKNSTFLVFEVDIPES